MSIGIFPSMTVFISSEGHQLGIFVGSYAVWPQEAEQAPGEASFRELENTLIHNEPSPSMGQYRFGLLQINSYNFQYFQYSHCRSWWLWI